MVNVRNNL